MPRYNYQIINEDGTEGEVIEIVHSITVPSLTRHPGTGQKIRKVFAVPRGPILIGRNASDHWNFKDSTYGRYYAEEERKEASKPVNMRRKSTYSKAELERIWHPSNNPPNGAEQDGSL